MINKSLEEQGEELFNGKALEDITLDDVDDISTVKISKKQNEYEKILDFIENTKNPYIFKCNGKFVKIEFANSNLTVSECLSNVVSGIYK